MPPGLAVQLAAGERLDHVEIELDDGWTYAPVIAHGELIGVFGTVDLALVVGDNLDAVFITNKGATLTGYGWNSKNRLAAAEYLRTVHGDPSILKKASAVKAEEDPLWQALGLPNDPNAHAPVNPIPHAELDDGVIDGSIADMLIEGSGDDPLMAAAVVNSGLGGVPNIPVKWLIDWDLDTGICGNPIPGAAGGSSEYQGTIARISRDFIDMTNAAGSASHTDFMLAVDDVIALTPTACCIPWPFTWTVTITETAFVAAPLPVVPPKCSYTGTGVYKTCTQWRNWNCTWGPITCTPPTPPVPFTRTCPGGCLATPVTPPC